MRRAFCGVDLDLAVIEPVNFTSKPMPVLSRRAASVLAVCFVIGLLALLRVFSTSDKVRSFIPNGVGDRIKGSAFINGQQRVTQKNETRVLTSRVSEAKQKKARAKFGLYDGSKNTTLSSEVNVFSQGVTKGLNHSQGLFNDGEASTEEQCF